MKRWLGKLCLRLFGWRFRMEAPELTQSVIIAAPHTSNWDFVFLLAAAWSEGIPIFWLGKKELFRAPFGGIMRALGGIAVNRSEHTNLVQQVAERYAAGAPLNIVIPPSGTRGKADHWRSGYYWIAHAAGVPVVCGYLDYEKKEAGLGYTFTPSGSPADDMDPVREFYEPITGRYPAQTTPVRMREEL